MKSEDKDISDLVGSVKLRLDDCAEKVVEISEDKDGSAEDLTGSVELPLDDSAGKVVKISEDKGGSAEELAESIAVLECEVTSNTEMGVAVVEDGEDNNMDSAVLVLEGIGIDSARVHLSIISLLQGRYIE